MNTRAIDLNQLDLNLLKVFAAVLDTGSVTAAAARCQLSQPAASSALKRLREITGDALFVRTPRGMRTTPYAEAARAHVAAALVALERAFAAPTQFDASSSDQTFRFYMTDIGETVFLPPLVAKLQQDAPKLKVAVSQLPLVEVRNALETGSIDFAAGTLPGLKSGVRSALLLKERYVGVVREGHALRGRVSMREMKTARFSVISPAGNGHQVIEDALVRLGLESRIALRVPQFMVLPPVLATSDLVLILPQRGAGRFMAAGAFRQLELPLSLPAFEVRLFWHGRMHEDPANQWMRERFLEVNSGH